MGGATIVVADEPTAELDSTSASHVMDTMVELARAGVTFVVATHDRSVMRRADAALELDHGIRRSAASVPADAADRSSVAAFRTAPNVAAARPRRPLAATDRGDRRRTRARVRPGRERALEELPTRRRGRPRARRREPHPARGRARGSGRALGFGQDHVAQRDRRVGARGRRHDGAERRALRDPGVGRARGRAAEARAVRRAQRAREPRVPGPAARPPRGAPRPGRRADGGPGHRPPRRALPEGDLARRTAANGRGPGPRAVTDVGARRRADRAPGRRLGAARARGVRARGRRGRELPDRHPQRVARAAAGPRARDGRRPPRATPPLRNGVRTNRSPRRSGPGSRRRGEGSCGRSRTCCPPPSARQGRSADARRAVRPGPRRSRSPAPRRR